MRMQIPSNAAVTNAGANINAGKKSSINANANANSMPLQL